MTVLKIFALTIFGGIIFAGDLQFKEEFPDIGFAIPVPKCTPSNLPLDALLEEQCRLPLGRPVLFIQAPKTPVNFLFGAAVTVIVDPKTGTFAKWGE